jgi:AraC family transcriptional regulator of adaptative response/methylated-DNA-[protein]-cysteine methyltransferase
MPARARAETRKREPPGQNRKNRVDRPAPVIYIRAMKDAQPHRDYDRIERALVYLAANRREQPDLDEVARHVGLSPHHLQRVFTRWAGVSPKRFLQYLTVEHAREVLAETRSVLDAALETGLSSPGRLHDLTVAVDAVTPGEVRSAGAGLTVRHGLVDSPFGICFMAVTDRGVCWLSFPDEGGVGHAADELAARFERADHVESTDEIGEWRDRIFRGVQAAPGAPLPILVSGTNFQLKVWEALLTVPPGGLCSYADLATAMGRPTATRAVASALAANHIAFLIPCHRVIRSMGSFGRYRWGTTRKRALIGWEQARRQTAAGR